VSSGGYKRSLSADRDRIAFEGLGFDDFFKEAVFQGIARVVGESSAEAILFHVNFSKNSKSPRKIHDALEGILGDSGAKLIERSIVVEMFTKLKEPAPDQNLLEDFAANVSKGKKIFLSRSVDD
jgi:hypothetical protein